MTTQKKETKPINSLNLWTTVFTIFITGFFTVNGTEVSFQAEDLAKLVTSESGVALISSLFLLLFTPVFKTIQRIKQYGYDWTKLKSRNMLAHLSSLLILVAGIWLDAEKLSFVVVLLTQLVNFVAHRFKFT